MTKAELVEKVADKIQLTKKQTETVVNILLNCITEALSEGDKVELRGFGSFRIRKRNPREGRNPKTGDTVQIPAKRVPFLRLVKNSARWLTISSLRVVRPRVPFCLRPSGSLGVHRVQRRGEEGWLSIHCA